jgi:hypothetical protein
VLWARGAQVSHNQTRLFHDIATLTVFSWYRFFSPDLQ